MFAHKFYQTKKIKSIIIAGISTFILNLILPFHSFVVYLTIGLFLTIQTVINKYEWKNNLKGLIIFALISLPSFIYLALIGITDPLWKIIEKQNVLPSPPIIPIIIGFGLSAILSFPALRILFKEKNESRWLLSSWLVAVILIAFDPIPMQRRVWETGVYIPLAILASYFILKIYNSVDKTKHQAIITLSIALFIIPGIIFNFNASINYAKKFTDPRIYLPKGNIEAMQWLKQNSPSDSTIIASINNGNVLPDFSDRFSYVGHAQQTVNFEQKLQKSYSLFSEVNSAQQIYNFLKTEKINYILYSQLEKNLRTFDPKKYQFLKSVYNKDDVEIYQFNEDFPPARQ